MKPNSNGLNIRSIIIAIFLFSLFLWGCGSGGEGTVPPQPSGGDIDAPVEAKLVHGTLFVVQTVVNRSIYLDMLMDTGSTSTYVPSGIFGNPFKNSPISGIALWSLFQTEIKKFHH
jgi:hypothetical protein